MSANIDESSVYGSNISIHKNQILMVASFAMVHHIAMIRHAISMIRHTISMIRHISMVRHITMIGHIISHGFGFVCGCRSGLGWSWVVVSHIPMASHIAMISHSCTMVFHVAMAHHTLGCALVIASLTVVDVVHKVGFDVWNGLPQVVEGFLRKRICNLNRVCSGRHGILTGTNHVLAIKVEAGFSLKGNSNGSLLVLKLNFQDASFTCLDSSYCVSPAFLDLVYVGEVAKFSLCRLAMVAHVAVVAHVVGCAVFLWQLHPLLSSDSIILALR